MACQVTDYDSEFFELNPKIVFPPGNVGNDRLLYITENVKIRRIFKKM